MVELSSLQKTLDLPFNQDTGLFKNRFINDELGRNYTQQRESTFQNTS